MPRSSQAGKPRTGKASLKAAAFNSLVAENAELRNRLNLPATSEEIEYTWDLVHSQKTRDQLAVRALLWAVGDTSRALSYLGFPVPEDIEGKKALALKVFSTPGVREMIEKEWADIEDARERIISRQVQIALHGSEEGSQKSVQILARIAGWQKPDNNNGALSPVNINVLVNGQKAEKKTEAIENPPQSSLLGHVPGSATRVRSEALEE